MADNPKNRKPSFLGIVSFLIFWFTSISILLLALGVNYLISFHFKILISVFWKEFGWPVLFLALAYLPFIYYIVKMTRGLNIFHVPDKKIVWGVVPLKGLLFSLFTGVLAFTLSVPIFIMVYFSTFLGGTLDTIIADVLMFLFTAILATVFHFMVERQESLAQKKSHDNLIDNFIGGIAAISIAVFAFLLGKTNDLQTMVFFAVFGFLGLYAIYKCINSIGAKWK